MLQEVEGARRFVFQQGPIFANLVLADEINRASPKTQSALLEAMQERRVNTVMWRVTTMLARALLCARYAELTCIELEGTHPPSRGGRPRSAFLFKLRRARNDARRSGERSSVQPRDLAWNQT